MSERFGIETVDVTRIYHARGAAPESGRDASETTGRWGIGKMRHARREIRALDRVSLRVDRGELFGLLGHNGAGKTTLIKILTTLLLPSGGRAYVCGLDVTREVLPVRRRISMVSGGEQSGYGILTVREQLWLFAQVYGIPARVSKRRIDDLLEAMNLTAQANQKIYSLSTGMRQKLNICRGLITDPEVLFLDEPTVGLDVDAARTVRTYVRRWIGERDGRTVLLTTHYMQEADELSDRVAIINQGRIVAEGTPQALKRHVQEHARFAVEVADATEDVGYLEKVPGVVRVQSEVFEGKLLLRLALRSEDVIALVIATISARGGRILALRKLEPTLEEVFIQLIGRRYQPGDDVELLEAREPVGEGA
jgi:ABC-2 type transport system ATP-binding protein